MTVSLEIGIDKFSVDSGQRDSSIHSEAAVVATFGYLFREDFDCDHCAVILAGKGGREFVIHTG